MITWLSKKWFDIKYEFYRFKEKTLFNLVWMFPHKIIEIAAVRVWANATTGRWGKECPTDVLMDEAIKRWARKDGGDKVFANSKIKY